MAKFVISDPPHEPEDFQFDVLPMTESNPTFRVGARLCNFPTNKESIRSEHAKWISDNLVPIFRSEPDCAIDLTGHASRKGAPTLNSPLSGRRLDAVRGLIESSAVGTNVKLVFQKSDPRGESEAEGFGVQDGDNSGKFRAVEVLAFAAKQPPRIIIPKLTPVGATKFKMRMVLSVGLGLPGPVLEAIKKALNVAKNFKGPVPITADIVLFEIVEDMPGAKKNQGATFAYVGGGFGLSQGIPVSKSRPPSGIPLGGAGPFSKTFETSRPVILPTFAGEAALGTPPGITIGRIPIMTTIVQLTMESSSLRFAKAVVSPRTIIIETGPGFSITLFSVTKGALIMTSPPRPFSGP